MSDLIITPIQSSNATPSQVAEHPAAAPRAVDLYKNESPSGDSSEASESSEGGEDGERVRPGADTSTMDERARERNAVKRARKAHSRSASKAGSEAGGEAKGEAGGEAKGEAGGEAASGAPDEAPETDTAFVARLRLREQEQRWREEAQERARSEANSILEQARSEAERYRKTAEDAARDEIRRKLREKPAETIREWQIPHEQLLRDIVDEGTPEGQIRLQIRNQQAQIEALTRKLSERDQLESDARQKYEAAKQAEQHASARAESERAFLTLASPDKSPSVRLYYRNDREILRDAYDVIASWDPKSGPCTDEKILASLEMNAKDRLDSLRQKFDASGNGEPQSKTLPPRTLHSAATGERRSTPKTPSEMTAAELADAERAAIRRARETYSKRSK